MKIRFPQFEPLSLFRGGHAQTIGAHFFPSPRYLYSATPRFVDLDDGDRIVLHDDCPETWEPGDRAAVLIHGLAGCHSSPYMQRVAAKLNGKGIRTFRLDLRGCGASNGLSRFPCHSGRSADAAAAIETVAELCPESPVSLIGFSLGGNITLKLLGETGANPPGHLDSAVAVCPPVDLLRCVRQIQVSPNHYYDRYFVRLLLKQHELTLRKLPDAPTFDRSYRPRKLIELDEIFTAPVSGFGHALNYYKECSAARFLHGIRVPTLILAAADDPLIPCDSFREADISPYVHLAMTPSGGHLGFLGRPGTDPDRRWMDWRIQEWVLHHHSQTVSRARPSVPRSVDASRVLVTR